MKNTLVNYKHSIYSTNNIADLTNQLQNNLIILLVVQRNPCMSGKALKPTLSGTRNKTRKRGNRLTNFEVFNLLIY